MSHQFDYAMQHAIKLALQGRWKTFPNPMVGAVLVNNGKIVAEGYHMHFGAPHAEVQCIANAKKNAIDISKCTLVVTLEPCNHYGKTPPCTDTIINENIAHIIIGAKDPTAAAQGGIEKLQAAGITVEIGILQAECLDLIADFVLWNTGNRPYVLTKLASTLDGKIATKTGHSRWVSSKESRENVHNLRAQIGSHGGAILIGGNTLYIDNPKLTSTKAKITKHPLAVILTSRLPETNYLYLLSTRPSETIFYTTKKAQKSTQAKKLMDQGIRIYALEEWEQGTMINPKKILEHLKTVENCPYVLCEGGGKTALSLLQYNLVDELHMYIAPKILGDNHATPLFDGRAPLTMNEALHLKIHTLTSYGSDIHLVCKPGD